MVEKSFDFSRGSVDGAHISDMRDKTSLSDVSLLGGISGGATIATIAGFKPVKSLVAGDLVLTQDNGYVPLNLVSPIAATQFEPGAPLVVIGYGALGADFPGEDLIVSQDQLIMVTDEMDGSDAFVRAGDLVRFNPGVRFVSEIANTYVLDCSMHESVLVNGVWMGTGYSSMSFTMMTLDAQNAELIGFNFDDVRPLCRPVQVPKNNRRSLRIVR